jgi:Chromo (CHRromatin Organisation MOdifier) domain
MLNYGLEPKLPLHQGLPAAGTMPLTLAMTAREEVRVPAAHRLHGSFTVMHAAAREHLIFAQHRQKQYADQKRREVEFAVGEQVLLNTRNIRLQAPRGSTTKLMPRWTGPFAVVEKVGSVAYRLDLPANLNMHPVFHVSLLKTYHSSDRHQLPPVPYKLDGELHYDVECLLEHRWQYHGKAKKPRRKFLVRWEGYLPKHDSWEPESSLANCSGPLLEYRERCATAGREIDEYPPREVKAKATAAGAAATEPVRARGKKPVRRSKRRRR